MMNYVYDAATRKRSLVPVEPADAGPEDARAARSAMRLSFAQLLIGLVTEGWITEAEGRAWLTRSPPGAVMSLINTLPPGQRFAAEARAVHPSVVLRTDALVQAMAQSLGKTAEELDAFFTTYALI